MWLICILIFLCLLLPPLFHSLYKGVIKQIVVVKRRETVRDIYDINIMSRWRFNNTSAVTHMTIDYRYNGKSFVFTANCFDGEMFQKLIPGNTYTVRIRLHTIISIES